MFGGKTMLLGGDFRQVLPVVEGGNRLDTIDASITNSYLWDHVKILKLTTNMRILGMGRSGLAAKEVKDFSDWVLSVGDGTAKGTAEIDDGDSELIEIPSDILVPRLDSAIDDIISSTYPNLEASYSDPTYLRERAIIAPKNDTIDEMNSRILSLVPGNEKVYLSSDTLVESSKENDVIGQLTTIHPMVQSSGLNGSSVRRSVEIRDLSDRVLLVTLWGEHATSFEDEFLIESIGNDEPVVIIFAGMQVKTFFGATTCASGSATKWYINIDTPEVNAFRASLEGRGSEVVLLPGDGGAAAGAIDDATSNRKSISELLSLDPHDNNDVRFTCDAKIKEIDVTNGWWYKGCSKCKRGLMPTFEGFE
ncbi:uncharacterized protein LOC120680956 [Panicum virgatum]|uniref:uncharacterized protein LOC120680956 n=1 Tax=Panicum virgatum TaxID=38727 RepID=UPI0019D5DB18|nr:uncharacterized protein LOC120680956 [Panicum virgatum]